MWFRDSIRGSDYNGTFSVSRDGLISTRVLTCNRFGDYQKEPEEPEVGSVDYPPTIYNSWDPNWRGFIGTTFIVALEEFGHLIPVSTTQLMLESLKNATIGDSYRVGGVDGDNLYPAYSNPVRPF